MLVGGWYCSTAGGKGKALVPLSLLVLQCRAGMGSPWGSLQRTIWHLLSARQRALSKARQCQLLHIHLLQSTSVHPKYSPCSCRTDVLQLSAHEDHMCYYARLKNNIQGEWQLFSDNKQCKNNKTCFCLCFKTQHACHKLFWWFLTQPSLKANTKPAVFSLGLATELYLYCCFTEAASKRPGPHSL